MSTTFYAIMQKRRDGMVYADLHKTDHRFYLTPEDAQWALEKDTANPEYFHVVELVAMTVEDWNELMKEGAAVTKLEEAANTIDQQAEQINELESEVLEQCRINGIGAEREAALLGKVAQQSAALKLAKEALEYCDAISSSRNFNFDMGSSAIAAIDALKGE